MKKCIAVNVEWNFWINKIIQRLVHFNNLPVVLKTKKEFVLELVRQQGCMFEFVSNSFKGDRDIALAAVTQFGKALEFASAPFKDNKDIVASAVNQCGTALKFASAQLRSDPEIVLLACNRSLIVKNRMKPLTYASRELKDKLYGSYINNLLNQFNSSFDGFKVFLHGTIIDKDERYAGNLYEKPAHLLYQFNGVLAVKCLVWEFSGVPNKLMFPFNKGIKLSNINDQQYRLKNLTVSDRVIF